MIISEQMATMKNYHGQNISAVLGLFCINS